MLENIQNKKKRNIYHVVIEQITGIFLPIIQMITAASIIKSIVMILASAGVLSIDSGVYRIFYAVSDGFFYFLPFYLAVTTAKQWKTDPYIALTLPVAMLYPDITAVLENGQSMSFLGLTVPPTIYHAGVIPVVLAVGMLTIVEKPLEKYLPEAIKGFMKPILCCIVVLPITFLVFGPLGRWIGDLLTAAFFTIYDWNCIAAGAFMGFVMQPMVVIGGHWSVVPVSINNIATNGFDVIMPLVGAAVYGQAGAAMAVAFMYKDKEKRRMCIQAGVTAILGVTEPALFGVNVPLIRPMLSACTAGAIGGAVVGWAGTKCYSFAFPSFLTSVAYVGQGFVIFLLSMAGGFILGFIFTFIQKKQIVRLIESGEKI